MTQYLPLYVYLCFSSNCPITLLIVDRALLSFHLGFRSPVHCPRTHLMSCLVSVSRAPVWCWYVSRCDIFIVCMIVCIYESTVAYGTPMTAMIVCRRVDTYIYTRGELFTLALTLTECNYYTRGNIDLVQSTGSKRQEDIKGVLHVTFI
jgi:hypothetical protein